MIIDNNTKLKLRQHLDAYANLMVKQIEEFGYCGEFISDDTPTDLGNTRLLCQTRGIVFLVDYANITQNNKYIVLAEKLFSIIQSRYYNQVDQTWTQYPIYITEQNTPKDKMLYEYAFIITAYAKLYTTTRNKSLISYIDQVRSAVFIDYYNHHVKLKPLNNAQNGINQNAPMHFFESLLEAAYNLNDDGLQKDLQVFGDNLLNEIYDNNYNLIREYSKQEIFEPGHSFEWASLIYEAKSKNLFQTSIDDSKLANTAENYGVTNTQMVIGEYIPNQANNLEQYRIWPLLERLRYYVMTNDVKAKLAIEIIIKHFFSDNDLPYEYISQDLVPLQEKVKATTGYHIINCYKYILNA